MRKGKTVHKIPGLSREAEEKQLLEILCIAQDNLMRAERGARQLSDDLQEVYGLMEAEESEAKQALLLLHNTQSQLQESQRELIRCQRARKKPYFGRIDFKDPSQPYEESYYVGRVGISQNGSDPVVIDWRAPVASAYYENALGPCKYTVKNEGAYKIELKRKRTYEIENDKLKDFFDSDVVATDELLNKYLAKGKKAVLGEIIATIQKEQNAIIRTSPKTNLIVQGVAGSGKTTVAMHRISYILYNYADDFRPEDFYIIGSNRILLNYITSVLPDLDVYGVSQMTMEQMFVRLLYEDWDPKAHRICPVDKKGKDACIKSSSQWFRDLQQFCQEYENAKIPQADVRLEDGALLLGERVVHNYLKENQQASMQGKINMLNEILLSRLENEMSGKYVSYPLAEKKRLQRLYRWHFGKDEWKGSIFGVYQEFLRSQRQKGKHVPVIENVFDVYDLAALAYLYKRVKETDGIREASHVIIDEAQDFGMMAYGALAYCLRGCTYTIMGDVSQNIHLEHGLNNWKELQKLILTGTFDHFGLLKKSYRNTVEISDFATGILRHGNFPIYPVEPISRHGKGVCVTECRDGASMLQKTLEAIQGWQRKGHETIAVICRDEAEAAMVSSFLGQNMALAGQDLETMEFEDGVMVLPVEYTKGLEFDAVLLYHPSAESYPASDQYVKLLYVAATRALHELAVVHQGDLTDLIGKRVSDGKRMRSLENERPKEAKRYQKKEITDKEQILLDVLQGEKERARRGYMGPKPILAQKPKQADDTDALGIAGQGNQQKKEGRIQGLAGKKPSRAVQREDSSISVNQSPYQFNECPDNSRLRPKGHSRIDNSVRIVRKMKKYVDFISSYGVLRLTPLEDSMIRVQFQKGGMAEFEPGYWDYAPEKQVSWKAKEGRDQVVVETGKVTVKVGKKTGALQFLDTQGKLLLAEKAALPRQIELDGKMQAWAYFDWPKKEKIFAKGILKDGLEPLSQKARYISFGGKKMRMPLLVSEYGYGIGAAAEETVMCCAIPTYGTYLYMEGTGQIDYYFLYGGDYDAVLGLYRKLQ